MGSGEKVAMEWREREERDERLLYFTQKKRRGERELEVYENHYSVLFHCSVLFAFVLLWQGLTWASGSIRCRTNGPPNLGSVMPPPGGNSIRAKAPSFLCSGRLLARAGDYAAAADIYEKVLELCQTYAISVGTGRLIMDNAVVCPLEVLCGNGGENLLLLAEGLLKKHIASHSLHEPEALMVYISLLEQQSKFSDALEVLSGKLGSLIMIEVDRLRIQGRLLARAGDYAAAADIYEKVLELCQTYAISVGTGRLIMDNAVVCPLEVGY